MLRTLRWTPARPSRAPGRCLPWHQRAPGAARAGVQAMVPYILGLSPVALIVGATIGANEARSGRGGWASGRSSAGTPTSPPCADCTTPARRSPS